MTLSVRDILRATGGQLISGHPTDLCERISIDSRTLKPGDVFFALQGPRFDGHLFLDAAAHRRAKAVVVHRLTADMPLEPGYLPDIIEVTDTLKALQDTGRGARKRADQTTVIGLTGSNGKTTTKEMLASILRRAGKTLATRGNLNNHIGLPLMLSELTPDYRFAVLEMGTSKKGDMDLLVDLTRPHIGLITNVGKDHLEFFGTPQGVLEENGRLFDALPKDGTAVINLEDPLIKEYAARLHCKMMTYGRVPEARVQAIDIVPYPTPLRFTLILDQKKYPVTLHMPGDMQVLNAMAAAAVAHAIGISPKDIVEGLGSAKAAPMRMEVRAGVGDSTLVNDAYNANPSSMRASIESFCHTYPDRPRWIILGDMRELGPTARQEHEDLGRWIATQQVDRVFLYGRDTQFILKGIASQGFAGVVERYHKKRYLIEALKRASESSPRSAMLFKASRRLQLEQVSHALSTSLRAMVSDA